MGTSHDRGFFCGGRYGRVGSDAYQRIPVWVGNGRIKYDRSTQPQISRRGSGDGIRRDSPSFRTKRHISLSRLTSFRPGLATLTSETVVRTQARISKDSSAAGGNGAMPLRHDHLLLFPWRRWHLFVGRNDFRQTRQPRRYPSAHVFVLFDSVRRA